MAEGVAGESTVADRWCLVTGGRGFAARHLVEMLLRSQKWRVKIADLAPQIKLEPREEQGLLSSSLASRRALYVSADLRNKANVVNAFQGVEVVFHMAAPDSSINNYQLHYSVNVDGTQNVIDACIECKVARLIYTSSPSVIFDGVHGLYNVDESIPYPEKFNDSYSETKAKGEKLVIKANGRNGLLTCCIRPSSIFGPGDRLMVPSLVSAACAGKSKFIIGDGNNLYDFTYVENVAHAHMCAEKTLASGGSAAQKAAGQAYFITNMEAMKFWEFMSRILDGLGYERPSTKIPVAIVMPIAHLVELAYKIFAPYGMRVPQLTPSRIRLLSCNRTFSCSKAKAQLGYEPIVSLEDGLRRTIEAYPDLRATGRTQKISKASVYLGNGNVANTLLWKDKKRTLLTLVILAIIYHYFFASGYTFITAVVQILLVITVFLFVHSLLPSKIFNYKLEKVPPAQFHLSEESSHQMARSAAASWNSLAAILKSLCRGKDWSLFLKVVLALLALSLLGTVPLQSLFKIGIPTLFIFFLVYEKWEEEIDALVHDMFSFLLNLKSKLFKQLQKHE